MLPSKLTKNPSKPEDKKLNLLKYKLSKDSNFLSNTPVR